MHSGLPPTCPWEEAERGFFLPHLLPQNLSLSALRRGRAPGVSLTWRGRDLGSCEMQVTLGRFLELGVGLRTRQSERQEGFEVLPLFRYGRTFLPALGSSQ